MRVQHIALKTNDLEGTYTFYTDILGCDEAIYDPEVGRVRLEFKDGFTLIFDRTDETLNPATVQYLGLELEDFAAVDRLYEQITLQVKIVQDIRERYRNAQGPYGFFIRDPNGYRIKVFRYKG